MEVSVPGDRYNNSHQPNRTVNPNMVTCHQVQGQSHCSFGMLTITVFVPRDRVLQTEYMVKSTLISFRFQNWDTPCEQTETKHNFRVTNLQSVYNSLIYPWKWNPDEGHPKFSYTQTSWGSKPVNQILRGHGNSSPNTWPIGCF